MPQRILSILAFAVCLFAGTAQALPVNPIDPSLPLSIHTRVTCRGEPSLGASQVGCFDANVVENPATLTSVVGTSEATAALSTGSLTSHSIARAINFGPDQLGAGSSEAKFYDTLTFDGSYTGPIELRMTVTGSFITTDSNPNVQGSAVFGNLFSIRDNGSFIAASGVRVQQANSGEVYLPDSTQIAQTNANPATFLFDPANVEFWASVVFPVTAGERTFSFLAQLGTTAVLGSTAPVNMVKEAETHFGNSARLSLLLPPGVGYTSTSEQFLVPEPGTGTLLMLGFTGVVLLGRRRHP